MAASAGEPDGAITAINVTPLVDIILVVLIIFMATAPLIQRRAMKVELPKAASHEKTATEALQVTIDAKKQISVGGQVMTLEELRRRLGKTVAGQPTLHVTLSGDKSLPYGDVIEVVDAIRGSGVKKLGLEVRGK